MYKKKLPIVSICLGLAILSIGEVTCAQDNNSSKTTGFPPTEQISTPVNNLKAGGIIRRGISFTGQTTGGINIPIPQEIFEAITISGTTDNNNTGIGTTENSFDQITICLTDSCSLGDGFDGNSIYINDLATLIQDDLNQALGDLVAAEQAASDGKIASDDSRKIVRRDSLDNENCGCLPGERRIARELSLADNSASSQKVKTIAEARDIFITKLEESSIFVEQVNQLKPENSHW